MCKHIGYVWLMYFGISSLLSLMKMLLVVLYTSIQVATSAWRDSSCWVCPLVIAFLLLSKIPAWFMYFASSCVAIAGMWATQQMNQFILISISYPAFLELEKKQWNQCELLRWTTTLGLLLRSRIPPGIYLGTGSFKHMSHATWQTSWWQPSLEIVE